MKQNARISYSEKAINLNSEWCFVGWTRRTHVTITNTCNEVANSIVLRVGDFSEPGRAKQTTKKIMKTIRSSVEFFKFILTTRSQPPHIANKHIVVSIVDSVYEFWQLLLSPVMRSSDRIKLLDDDEKRNILWNCFYFYFGIFAARSRAFMCFDAMRSVFTVAWNGPHSLIQIHKSLTFNRKQ